MNERDYNQLREASWRRRLTQPEEVELQTYLAAHPHAREDWRTDAELNQLLEQLPAVPLVAANFTAQVMRAVKPKPAARMRGHSAGWPAWRGIWNWLPKAAMAGLVIGFVSLGYQHHQVSNRAALARNVVAFTEAASASDSELLADLEPIRRLSDSQPKADIEILALMK